MESCHRDTGIRPQDQISSLTLPVENICRLIVFKFTTDEYVFGNGRMSLSIIEEGGIYNVCKLFLQSVFADVLQYLFTSCFRDWIADGYTNCWLLLLY